MDIDSQEFDCSGGVRVCSPSFMVLGVLGLLLNLVMFVGR